MEEQRKRLKRIQKKKTEVEEEEENNDEGVEKDTEDTRANETPDKNTSGEVRFSSFFAMLTKENYGKNSLKSEVHITVHFVKKIPVEKCRIFRLKKAINRLHNRTSQESV